jgi:excisionase family DNA binding protein
MSKYESDKSELLTVHEVAQALRVDDTTVRRWIKNGVMEAVSLPHRGLRQAYRIHRRILERLLEGTTVAA